MNNTKKIKNKTNKKSKEMKKKLWQQFETETNDNKSNIECIYRSEGQR